tara:strand:- start:151 stop:519 length:369 start_codon:yes stop_codon:yes gene_type:complete
MLKFGLIAGSLFSMLSVILGAFGAHYLKNTLNDYSLSVFQTGVLYQFFHSIGIILVVLLSVSKDNLNLDLSIWFFTLGIILFSGSLYLLAITGLKWLGAITPFGGFFFILGWMLLFLKSLKI